MHNVLSALEAETAVDVAKALRNVTNQSLSAQTMCHSLKAAGLKAVAKKKKPFLSKRLLQVCVQGKSDGSPMNSNV